MLLLLLLLLFSLAVLAAAGVALNWFVEGDGCMIIRLIDELIDGTSDRCDSMFCLCENEINFEIF
jgi:hypothetical protein